MMRDRNDKILKEEDLLTVRSECPEIYSIYYYHHYYSYYYYCVIFTFSIDFSQPNMTSNYSEFEKNCFLIFLFHFLDVVYLGPSGVWLCCRLTLAGLAVIQQAVTIVTAAVVAIEHAHALVVTAVVPKGAEVDH